MTLAAGTQLGPYKVLGAIGAGGMGEVYQAHDTKLGRDVAIKVLPKAFAHDAERLSRFQREAKMLASLNHPNIAMIYGPRAVQRHEPSEELRWTVPTGKRMAIAAGTRLGRYEITAVLGEMPAKGVSTHEIHETEGHSRRSRCARFLSSHAASCDAGSER
jgi:serine/threonine protein kinase